MTNCTCKTSRTPCTMAFVYNAEGQTLAEIPIENTAYLREGLIALCAGAALQKLNRELKANAQQS